MDVERLGAMLWAWVPDSRPITQLSHLPSLCLSFFMTDMEMKTVALKGGPDEKRSSVQSARPDVARCVCVCGDQRQFLSTKAERSGESVAGKVAGVVSHTSLSLSLASVLRVEGEHW